MIEVKNLVKNYGQKRAVDNISFTVEEGTILGFLGPNGAGKSTTMNILTGYISATEGDVLINGVNILDDPSKAKAQIGYLPEIPPVYPDMTVKEYLDFVYDLKKCKLPREQHMNKICELVRIKEVYNRMIKNLSKGYRQRVGLAQALINNPPILILDEPTVGLDPKQIIEIRTLIQKLGQNRTVILSSHILSEIQAVCDKIIIINKGHVAANDTPDNISKALSKDHHIIARIEGPKDKVLDEIDSIAGVVSVNANLQKEEGVFEYTIESEENVDIRRTLFKIMADNNFPILELKTAELTLEDIFLKITMGEGIEVKTHNEQAEKPKEQSKAKNKKKADKKADGGDK